MVSFLGIVPSEMEAVGEGRAAEEAVLEEVILQAGTSHSSVSGLPATESGPWNHVTDAWLMPG